MRAWTVSVCLAAGWLIHGGDGLAAAETVVLQIETIERRIAVLEEQSRAALAALEELKRELEKARRGVADEPAALPSSPTADESEEQVTPRGIAIGSSRLEPYGFIRFDVLYDDSPPDHPQFPAFILSADPRLGPPGDGQLNLHPRLTRFGMRFSGPPAEPDGLTLTGLLEVDFQNGGRESRQVPRMRHGWLRVDRGSWSLLAGQTWDVISPLFPTVNGDSLMWNAGNLGDRRPQVRLSYEPVGRGVSLVAALGQTGAVDGKDLDGDGIRDGDDSSLPNLQVRLGGSGERGRGKSWSYGLYGHYAEEETTRPVSGQRKYESHSIGIDYRLQLGERFTLQGEAWRGSNLSDFRGGIGQGVDPSTGEEIDSRGGWIELGFRATRDYSLFTGVTLDDPDDDDLPAGGRTRNQALYLTQRLQLSPSLLIGIDYLRWVTDFKGFDEGTDNRFNLYLVYGL